MLCRIRYILILGITLLAGLRAAGQMVMPDHVCIGATKQYWVDSIPGQGNTYTWRVNGVVQQNGPVDLFEVTWNTTGVQLIEVQETSAEGCSGPVRSGQVTVDPIVSPTFSAFGPYCQYTSAGSLPVASLNGITGSWSPNSINTTVPGLLLFTFTPDPGQCADTVDINITIDPQVAPVFSIIGPLCQHSIAPLLSSVSLNGISGTWNPAVINTATAGTTTYTFTPGAGQCAATASLDITIDELVIANAGPDLQLCNAGSFSLAGNPPVTGTPSWAFISGPSTPIILTPGTANTMVTGIIPSSTPYAFSYTVSNGSCLTTDTVLITNHAEPSASFAGPDQYLCSSFPAMVSMNANTPLIGTGTWTQVVGPAPAIITNPGSPVTPISIPVAGLYMFDWSISNGTCSPSSSATTVFVTEPATVIAGPDDIICETQSSYLLGSAIAMHTSAVTWTSSGDGSFSDPAIVNPVYYPGAADIISGTATLTLTGQGNFPCPDVSSSLTLSISRQAVVNAGPDAVICENETSYSLSSATANYFSSLTWTTSGDGSFSNISSVNPDYSPGPGDILNGNVLLTMQVSSNAPCQPVSDVMMLTIVRKLSASAGPDDHSCQGDSYPITGSSAANFSTISWTHTGSGTLLSANSVHPTYVPAASETGAITFTLHAFSNLPCTDSAADPMTLWIEPLPTAVLSGRTSVCEGDTAMLQIDFTGTAPWTVTYSDGISSVTISNILSSPYNFSVIAPVGSIHYNITALADAYCNATPAQLSGSATVIVHPSPVTEFTANSACEGDTTYFTASGAYLMKISHWTWNFGDGTYGIYNTPVNPGHVYPASGTYLVTLTVEDTIGCTYTISHNTEVRPLPTAFFNNTTPTCTGSPTYFTDLSSIQSNQGYIQEWSWNFGDGSPVQNITFPNSPNLSYTYPEAGTYAVVLTITSSNGCIDSHTEMLTVTPKPLAAFEVSSNCAGQAVHFTDLSTTNGSGQAAGWAWDFGDPASGVNNTSIVRHPDHIFSGSGTYPVTLIVTNFNGCTDTVTHSVTIYPAPTVAFSSTAGCAGNPTSFMADPAIVNIDSTATYFWNFGDGNTGLNQITQHSFAAAGTYSVSLTITNLAGCSATQTQDITITVPPVAHFSASLNTCSDEPVLFSDLSTSANGYIVSWNWNFGDGSSQTILFPAIPIASHLYSQAGIYNVTLTVMNDLGCTSSEAKTIQVAGRPVAEFMSEGHCASHPVSFTDLSTAGNQQIISNWNWNFGDPLSGTLNSSQLQNPEHSFTAPGSYTVTLVATTGNGCQDTIQHAVIIKAAPLTAFTFQGSCLGSPVQFEPDPTGMNVTAITSWSWNFGDGHSSNQPAPAHTYLTTGTYTVSLTVSDTTGCLNTATHSITVSEPPVVSFEFSSPGCPGSSITFTDQTLTSGGFIVRRNWNFGDGTSFISYTPGATTVNHTYNSYGTFAVTLSVTTSDSCTVSLSRTLIVYSAPSPLFSFEAGCEGNGTQFHDLSSVAGNLISGRQWDFGDPGSGSVNYSTLANPVHTYSAAGTYNVKLIVSSASGCSDTTTQSVAITPGPFLGFSFASSCSGDTTAFNSSSYVNVATISNWNWQFGDGSSSSQADPVHIYSAPGSYNVTLTITDNTGCQSQLTQPVNIAGGPSASFMASGPACQLSAVTYTDLSVPNGNAIVNWTWNFGDGSQQSFNTYTPSVTHSYSQAGSFAVSLTISTQNGCESSSEQLVSISPAPEASFSYSNTCEGEATLFTDESTATGYINLSGWSWNFGEPGSGTNNSSSLQNPSHQYSAAGLYNVMLIVSNASGCADTLISQVNIHLNPEVEFFTDSITCHGSPVTFHPDPSIMNLASIQSYDWDFGDGSAHSNQSSPSHSYDFPGTYIVTLAVNDMNCSNAISHPVTIHEGPVSSFSYEQSCVETATLFTDLSSAPLNSSIILWSWDFGVNGSVSDTSSLQNPSFTYQIPGTYTVTLTTTSDAGCTHTVSKPVQIWNKPVANFTYSTSPCSNGSVQFRDSSFSHQATITGWLWEFEPYQYSTQRNPLYTYYSKDTSYTVRLMVTDLRGCVDTTLQQVIIPDEFRTTITFQSTCFGSRTQFTPQLISPSDDQIVKAVWDFGDYESGSNTSTKLNPEHIFSHPGFYTVHLTATDRYGCTNSALTTVEILALPEVSFNWTNIELSTNVEFTGTALPGGTETEEYRWTFGDGTSLVSNPPVHTLTHTYPSYGWYHVMLAVTDRNGCTGYFSDSVYCSDAPQAALGALDSITCQNSPVTLQNHSNGPIDRWIWNWGDGTDPVTDSVFRAEVSHTYQSKGSYTVSLKIITYYNDKSLTDSSSRVIHVLPAPEADFETGKLCLGDRTQFTNTSKANDSGFLKYSWSFGDPSSSSDTSDVQHPSYRYSQAGSYQASLIAVNRAGCSDTLSKEVKVNGLPVAQFNNSIACQGTGTFFFDQSEPYEDPLQHRGWRIGDTKIVGWMSGESASFTFDTTGIYPVMLSVTDANGCMDTIMKNVKVNPSPLSAFSITENYQGEQGRLKLENGSIDGKEYSWYLGNGEVSYSESPEVTFDQDGTYPIVLFTTNEYGCTDSTMILYEMMFKGLYVPSAFAPGGPVEPTSSWKPAGVNLAWYKAEVYGRFEGLIWSSTLLDENGSPAEGWDGTYKGKFCQPGVYTWRITAIYRDGSIWQNKDVGNHEDLTRTTSGSIVLIR